MWFIRDQDERKSKHEIEDYIIVYNGIDRDTRRHSQVGLLIHKKYKQHIEEGRHNRDGILQVKLNINEGRIYLIRVYSPDISKAREKESTVKKNYK